MAVLGGCGGDFDPSTASGKPTDVGSAVPGQSWSLVALPDTQSVVSASPEILYAQTAWIAEQARTLNIEYVVHEGDMTHDPTVGSWVGPIRLSSISS